MARSGPLTADGCGGCGVARQGGGDGARRGRRERGARRAGWLQAQSGRGWLLGQSVAETGVGGPDDSPDGI